MIIKKSYKNFMKNFGRTYEKLTTTSKVSYENVKLAARDVIRETLCQRLLLVEYFELKISDNQSDAFLRMVSKMTYRFPKKILQTYKRLMKILRRT